MIQGPLVASRHGRRFYQTPKLENGNLSGTQPARAHRILDWLRAAVQVQGRPDWVFVKLHTHGAKEENAEVLLGSNMLQFHRDLAEIATRERWNFYYVTAREMALCVRQAEQGLPLPDFSQMQW